MKKNEILKDIRIDLHDDSTVFIQNKHFNFMYNTPDKYVKEEFIGKYRNFGGLQSQYEKDSIEYNRLYDWLCTICEKTILIIKQLN